MRATLRSIYRRAEPWLHCLGHATASGVRSISEEFTLALFNSSKSSARSPGSGRKRSVRSAPDRSSLEVPAGDPALDRVALYGRTTASGLTATFATALGLTIASAAQTPIGWSLTALAALIGFSLPLLWNRLRGNVVPPHPPIWQLTPRWGAPVAEAAAQAEHLRQLATHTPAGPVADHFAYLAESAEKFVAALHTMVRAAETNAEADARLQDPNLRDPSLRHDMARIVAELAELVEAAEDLRRAQRQHLEPSPLTNLTAETRQLTAAIEAQASTDPDPVEGTSG